MAGDWIKVEMTTPDKPEVQAMAAALGIDPDAVVGKLIRLWVWADAQSVDGNALIVTETFLDRLTYCAGFAAALRAVGWLDGADGNLSLPNFAVHNGQTAKNRAVTGRRVKGWRAGRNGKDDESVTPPPLQKSLPEKRREDKGNVSTAGARDAAELAEGESAFGGPSLGQAKAMAARSMIEERVAVSWWQSLEAVGWRDTHGRPIVAADHLLVRYAATWAEKDREKAARPVVGRSFGPGPVPTVNVDKFAGRPVVTAAGADGLGTADPH